MWGFFPSTILHGKVKQVGVAYNSNHATRLERVGGSTILTRYADYLVAQA